MQDLKICHLGRNPASTRVSNPALTREVSPAEDCLLAEEVGLGLFPERGFKHDRAGCPDTFGIGKGNLVRIARVVLMDSNECGHPVSFLDTGGGP